MKNIATAVMGVAMVVTLSFAFATPTKAQTVAELQAMVNQLLAQIASLSGGSTTTTGGSCNTFTRDHQMGDTGGEVMWIQQFLNSKGFQVAATGAGSPGNESSYFGSMTRAAISRFQAANGVTPTAGFWGPITRAKANAMCTPGTTTGTTPTTPGSTGLTGTAGSLTVTSTSEDVEDDVQTGSTEKVMGMKLEAQGSDVRVTNVRVKFTKTTSGSASDYLTAYFSEISIWADGQKIGSLPSSSFTRDSAGIYSASIAVNQIVRMGSSNEATFHIGATAVSSVDSDDISSGNTWEADVTQVRYTDAVGAVLFETPGSIVGNTGINVDRLSSSSDVKLRMGEGSGNPKTANIKVSESNSQEVTLAEFTLKAEGTDITFDRLYATSTVNGTLTNVSGMSGVVQAFYLYKGSSRVAEVSGTDTDGGDAIDTNSTSQSVFFTLDDLETISMGDTQTYRIVAKVNAIDADASSGYTNGLSIAASTSPVAYNINAKASDGKTVTERTGSITTYTQTLYAEGVQVTKVGESFTLLPNDTAANVAGEFKVTVRVTNFGSNDVYIPLNAIATTTAGASTELAAASKGINFYVTNGTTATSTAVSGSVAKVSGGTSLTNSVRISGGSSADFVLTTAFNPGVDYVGTQQYRVQVGSIGHTTSDSATPATLVVTLPLEDFRTAYYTVQN